MTVTGWCSKPLRFGGLCLGFYGARFPNVGRYRYVLATSGRDGLIDQSQHAVT